MANLVNDACATVDRWFRDHSGQVLAYLLHRTDPDTAQDVMQDVFVVACRRWRDIPEPPVGWLFGAARRLLANKRRGLRRHDNLVQRIAEVAALETDPQIAAERASLADLLEGLSATDREVLTLSSWYDLSPADAALALGCSISTYNVRLHRARRRLAGRVTAGPATAPTKFRPEVLHD